MSVTATCLINAKFAANSATTEYTAPDLTTTIIDKFTATNTDSGAQTITIYLVPVGSSFGDSNMVVDTYSIAAATTKDFSELQNQILEAGDVIAVVASAASMVVIRASGREIT